MASSIKEYDIYIHWININNDDANRTTAER